MIKRLYTGWAWHRLRRLLPGERSGTAPVVLWILEEEQFSVFRPLLDELGRSWGADRQRWILFSDRETPTPEPSFAHYVLGVRERRRWNGIHPRLRSWIEAERPRWALSLKRPTVPESAEILLCSGALWRITLDEPPLEGIADVVWALPEGDPEYMVTRMACYAEWLSGFRLPVGWAT
mgnify:CR=1 FL=1|nr:MAG: hypothetical protein KatS3mg041_1866 [Bacteroidota bacterium]